MMITIKNAAQIAKMREAGAAVLESLTLSGRPTDSELRTYLVGKDDKVSLTAAKLCCRLGACEADTYERVRGLIESDSVRKLSQLAVGGREMSTIGLSGEEIGKMLQTLIFAVAKGDVKNTKEELIKLAQNKRL